MTGLAGGQDEGNIVILIIYPKKNKLILPSQQWMDTGFVRFCSFIDLDLVSVHIRAKKELGQYPAVLTKRLISFKAITLVGQIGWASVSSCFWPIFSCLSVTLNKMDTASST